MTATAAPVLTDLYDEVMYRDPHPRYRELRQTAPLSLARTALGPERTVLRLGCHVARPVSRLTSALAGHLLRLLSALAHGLGRLVCTFTHRIGGAVPTLAHPAGHVARV